MTSVVVVESLSQTRDRLASLVGRTSPGQPDSHQPLIAVAVRLQSMLEDPDGILPRWRTRGFVRLVDLARIHLDPIGSLAALAESYGREASRHDPLETAYALRWLELANGGSRPTWSSLVGGV